MANEEFETKSARLERRCLVTVQTPVEDVDRLMAAVLALTPLTVGAYDSNAYQSAGGIERYRPRAGAAAGPETAVRLRPGVVELAFELPDEPALLAAVVEALFQVHSYQEPVIRIAPILSIRSKGLDDRDNPHRWWNTTGDWKAAQRSATGP